jgi:GT2 family glycosyltransferase
MDLSILIVTWNVWDLLRACLSSIERATRAIPGEKEIRAFGPTSLGNRAPTVEVIVVDNGGDDATADLLPARFPWVRYIRSATNLGFTAGNNVGYATSRGQAIYFLNPDTELLDSPGQSNTEGGDSLWILNRALIDNPTVALVGAQLRQPNNDLQPSRFRFPTPLTPLFEPGMFARYWKNNPWTRRRLMNDWPSGFRQEVDWVSGAAMLARREALEQIRQPGVVGPFDESFFMYSEEVDLCHRLKDAGWQILHVPDVIVLHYIGSSSGQVVAARDIYYYRSAVRYAQKYFGPLWASVTHLAVICNFRLQLLIEGSKWLLGHKRALRRQRITAYRQVLASNLYPKA